MFLILPCGFRMQHGKTWDQGDAKRISSYPGFQGSDESSNSFLVGSWDLCCGRMVRRGQIGVQYKLIEVF